MSIELRSVSKIYESTSGDRVTALNNVSLTVEKGSLVVLIGPSGSGKTTLLNVVAALDFPTRGSVVVNGLETAKLQRKQLQEFRNQTVGVIFQQFFLVDHMTVKENVAVPLIPEKDLTSGEKKELVLSTLARVGLLEKADRLPSELSGGELQRVAIARGLIHDADVILADEPTGNLDFKTGLDMIELLAHESENKSKTVIISTHDLRVLEQGDLVAHLQDGVVIGVEERSHRG